MHLLISFNREILPRSEAFLSAVSAAAFYGRGVFTTLAARRGAPFLWELHEKRLRENAIRVGLDPSEIDFKDLSDDLLDLIASNRLTDGRARITLFDCRSSRLWQSETARKTCVLIVTAEERRETLDTNLKLTVSPFRVNSQSSLVGVKSCNYLENILTLEAATAKDFDEAVRLNERGEIVSATMANLFWTREERIFTPALSTGALAGTTREFVINLTAKMGFQVLETTASLRDLQTADEIFLTSAGLGVCSVKSLDSQVLSNRITRKIQMRFSGYVDS